MKNILSISKGILIENENLMKLHTVIFLLFILLLGQSSRDVIYPFITYFILSVVLAYIYLFKSKYKHWCEICVLSLDILRVFLSIFRYVYTSVSVYVYIFELGILMLYVIYLAILSKQIDITWQVRLNAIIEAIIIVCSIIGLAFLLSRVNKNNWAFILLIYGTFNLFLSDFIIEIFKFKKFSDTPLNEYIYGKFYIYFSKIAVSILLIVWFTVIFIVDPPEKKVEDYILTSSMSCIVIASVIFILVKMLILDNRYRKQEKEIYISENVKYIKKQSVKKYLRFKRVNRR